jgi:seryl-tRNA(Sec) selenium transferase
MSPTRKTLWSRREVLKQSGMVSAMGAVTSISPLAANAAAALALDPKKSALPPSAHTSASSSHSLARQGTAQDNLFTKIGIRPIINAHGTYTIISGSCSLPQVKQAMYEASFYFVQMDEMMDAVGAELSKLTGAEWGIATNGCCSAISLATLACLAGTDVEKALALPYIKKTKDQVIIPQGSRNQYDIGVRQTGVQIVDAATPEELRAKLTDRVAMIYILSGPSTTAPGPMSIASICAIAKEKGVPVFVDAAAEEPNRPNIHFQAGASLVGYSGGKCMRGPQSSGLLLGSKSLCKAAYFQAAPHHCFGRPLKCSKEETMGILAAVREWYSRDHEAEQAEWVSWMQQIGDRVKSLPSVNITVIQAKPLSDPTVDLSNRCPELHIAWDPNKLGITGTEVAAKLDAGTPRIVLDSSRGQRPLTPGATSQIGIVSYMMEPGDVKIVGDAIYEALSKPGHYEDPVAPTGTPASVAGKWAVTIQYLRGTGTQQFDLTQNGSSVTGTQTGEIFNGSFGGGGGARGGGRGGGGGSTVQGNQVTLSSAMPIPGNPVRFVFKGTVHGDTMAGTVNMGEYGDATWNAVKA